MANHPNRSKRAYVHLRPNAVLNVGRTYTTCGQSVGWNSDTNAFYAYRGLAEGRSPVTTIRSEATCPRCLRNLPPPPVSSQDGEGG